MNFLLKSSISEMFKKQELQSCNKEQLILPFKEPLPLFHGNKQDQKCAII